MPASAWQSAARDTAEDLIRDADVALYEAKGSGKDRSVVFRPEMQTAVHDRLELEMDLRQAIEAGQLYVVYQPIFDLTTLREGRRRGSARWRHPQRGVIALADFIPVAEEAGLIGRIGKLVLNTACGQAATWHRAGYPISMAVNVSPRQLDDPRFIDDVRAALGQSGLDPSSLTLEITESTIMRNRSDPDVVEALKATGYVWPSMTSGPGTHRWRTSTNSPSTP